MQHTSNVEKSQPCAFCMSLQNLPLFLKSCIEIDAAPLVLGSGVGRLLFLLDLDERWETDLTGSESPPLLLVRLATTGADVLVSMGTADSGSSASDDESLSEDPTTESPQIARTRCTKPGVRAFAASARSSSKSRR